jgi:hypothetical protein
MPNKYYYNYTLEEKIEEEDREARNDLYRQQTAYYKSCTDINNLILSTLKTLNKEEMKDVITGKLVCPVTRI